MKATNQQERISARVTPEVRATLRQAAETAGTTLNQFLVQSALREAYAIIEREQIIRLTQRDAELFFSMLENPPAPSKKLREAITANIRLSRDASQTDRNGPARTPALPGSDRPTLSE